MQAATKQDIPPPASYPPGSSYNHATSSYASSGSWSNLEGQSIALGPPRPPLAWASVRHQVSAVDEGFEDAEPLGTGQCQHAVLITCLHLAHEMNQREVGQYAWLQPQGKDSQGSMLKLMKGYTKLIQNMDSRGQIAVRSAPDPSKQIIQHHLLRSRQLAGPDSYVMAFYTGHGIQEPPTEAGELWCYDKSFEECALDGGGPTEYIPMVLFEVLSWAGASSCYVWDCHHAGRLIASAHQEAAEIDRQLIAAAVQNPEIAQVHPAVYAKRQIHFAACGANERIPKIPGMPDDIFTICLLSPLKIAVLYHNLQTFPLSSTDTSKQRSRAYMDALWEAMSPDLKGRLWCELVAILHTIAWQAMDGAIYQRIFGQSGHSISQLASGFLMSQRVLGAYNAKPESIPAIPSTTTHPLWVTWDLILENFFEQLPEFFDAETDPEWEAGIQMLSFMEDQLNSILAINQAPVGSYLAENNVNLAVGKLPIICQAALTKPLRLQACSALDACLAKLGPTALVLAIQCGALEIALDLLALDVPPIADLVISIWASLIKHDGAIRQLAEPVKQATYFSDVKAIVFFLHHLEVALDDGDDVKVVECAAILCTIINYIPKRSAPKFLSRSLDLVMRMLDQRSGLIQQWGALFTAALLHGLEVDEEGSGEVLAELRGKLMGLVDDRTVETRAAMLYAVRWWFAHQSDDELEAPTPVLELINQLLPQAATDAAIQVRQEMYILLQHVLVAAGKWAAAALWLYQAQQAAAQVQPRTGELVDVVKRLRTDMRVTELNYPLIDILMRVVKMVCVYSNDPEKSVRRAAREGLSRCRGLAGWEPKCGVDVQVWDDTAVDVLLADGRRLSEVWEGAQMQGVVVGGKGERAPNENQDLFKMSRLSLRAYLASTSPHSEIFTKEKDRTWILRHRVLEDSLVLAEQQAGLPWKFSVKDVECADPCRMLSFHSFNSTVISTNRSPNFHIWNWESQKKTGTIRIELPPNAWVSSGRFVNELHETNVVLAEISKSKPEAGLIRDIGDIHVYAGPSEEPGNMKPISSFLALNIKQHPVEVHDESHRRLMCTWWRLSGLLGVGGPASIVNIWDCPAEQRVRTLSTGENSALTTLITEPKSGNLLVGGWANGMVKLFDLRHAKTTAVLEYQGDTGGTESGWKGIKKLGIFLGESRHITSACGYINIHDIRNLSTPAATRLAQPGGTSGATFQPHSGLMSTIGTISHRLAADGQSIASHAATFGLYRSTLDSITLVTEDTLTFAAQKEDVVKGYKPYTFFHPLRPFLSVGYGRSCHLRGSGVGEGADCDSGSYSFLQAQAKYML